jgi:hypothetical protein
MRDGDELDLGRLDADTIELLGERDRELPARRAVLADAALLQRREGVADAGLPHQVPLGVPDEVAVGHHVERLALVHARRPARLIGRAPLPAFHHIEPLDARALRQGRCRHRTDDDCGE